MKFYVAWLFSTAFYWLGHIVSRPIAWIDEGPEWLMRASYLVYQSLMNTSIRIDDWGNAGVWRHEEESPVCAQSSGEQSERR